MPILKELGIIGNITDYDYSTNGEDWKYLMADANETNYCGVETEHQSPINLMDPIGSYGWAYGLPVSKDKDNVQK